LVPGDATLPGMLTVLAALSSTTKTIEFVIIAVVVLLLILTIVLYARKNAQMKKPTTRRWPELVLRRAAGRRAGPVAAPPAQTFAAAQPDPFAGFARPPRRPSLPTPHRRPAAGARLPGPRRCTGTGPRSAGTSAAPVGPLPGTPAGWLPDPSGAPDTLRYWDGNAWTQHVAQRG